MSARSFLLRVSLGGLLCCMTADSPSVAGGADLFCMAQFSYFCDGKLETISELKAWNKALGLAALVLNARIEIAGLENVTHYHSVKVKPGWSKKLQYKTTVGRHLFYVKKRSDL